MSKGGEGNSRYNERLLGLIKSRKEAQNYDPSLPLTPLFSTMRNCVMSSAYMNGYIHIAILVDLPAPRREQQGAREGKVNLKSVAHMTKLFRQL